MFLTPGTYVDEATRRAYRPSEEPRTLTPLRARRPASPWVWLTYSLSRDLDETTHPLAGPVTVVDCLGRYRKVPLMSPGVVTDGLGRVTAVRHASLDTHPQDVRDAIAARPAAPGRWVLLGAS